MVEVPPGKVISWEYDRDAGIMRESVDGKQVAERPMTANEWRSADWLERLRRHEPGRERRTAWQRCIAWMQRRTT